MASVFTDVEEGKWILWANKKNNYLQCCDCLLVHRFEWRVVNGELQMRLWRDNRSTANCRRATKPKDKKGNK